MNGLMTECETVWGMKSENNNIFGLSVNQWQRGVIDSEVHGMKDLNI